MAIGQVPGYALQRTLDRQGQDLSFISTTTSSPNNTGSTLLYFDYANWTIGINEPNPVKYNQSLVVTGNILANAGAVLTTGNLQYDLGNVTNQWRTLYTSNLYGTLLTNTQPNITTVGNITNLNITGNLTVGGVAFANVQTSGNLNAGNNRIIYVATPINSTDAVNKAYVDAVSNNIEGNLIPLGTATDGNLADNNAAYLGFTTNTSVTDAIDILNSVSENLFLGTFVRSVTFSANTTAGGAGQTILLTMVPQGNVNQYTISWGDGSANTITSSASVAHTYATNVGTPFTVIVNATNTNGASPSNVANAVRTNYITIYGPDPALGFSTFRANISTTPLSGSNLYSIQGNAFYLQNTTTNTNTATVTWSINWGDGLYANVPNNLSAGGVLGPYANHTYTSNSGASTFSVNLALLTDDIANPAILPRYTSTALKVYSTTPPIPFGVQTRSLTYGTSVGTNPALSASVTDNTGGTTLTVGAAVNRATNTQATINANAGTIASILTYNGNAGVLTALVNGIDAGNINLANPQTPGLYGNLWLSSLSDYNLFSQSGTGVTFASSIYYPGWGYGFTANVTSTGSKLPVGVNRFNIIHSTTGRTSNVDFVVDDVTSVPTVTSGNLAIKAAGTYRYISGIPYFNTGSPQLWWQDITISNWIGQTFNNTANVAYVVTGTNLEGSTGNVILANSHAYVNMSNVSSPMLNAGTPTVGTGVSSPYTIANLTLAINQASVRSIANVAIAVTNVNGTSLTAYKSTTIQVHTAAQSGISEIAISANTSANTNPAVRSTYFLSSTVFNPSYVSSTNFMTSPNVYTETADPGVAGTREATIRLGVLKFSANNYSTGYLPVGPNRSADGTSFQYFTFAFQRTVTAQFNLNIVAPSGVANVWIAAPGTTLDNTSGGFGWFRCDTTYAGSGKPGVNVGAGGNGTDGVAVTSGDRILANTALNGAYRMTLGTENLTNATNNVCLVRIALASGQTVTTLAVS
jgi:hypothetical protein